MIPAIRKIAGDLKQGWGRILLLLIVVLVGQAAMTASVRALLVVQREIDRNYAMAEAPDATVDVTGFDGAVDQLDLPPEVARIDAVASLPARYLRANGTWGTIVLFGRRNFGDLRTSRIFPQSGSQRPGPGEVLIEQSGVRMIGGPGQRLTVGYGRGGRTLLTITGVVHDPAQAPSWQENALYGYIPYADLVRMTPKRPVQLQIKLKPGALAAGATRALAEQLMERGARVIHIKTTPATHPHADLMGGLLILLGVFSFLSFVLSMFLTASIVGALTQRQQRHFAVLRALGASRLRIGLLHLAFVLIPGLTGLLLGALAGRAGARLLQNAIADQLNLVISDGGVPQAISNALLIVGLTGILLALAIPIFASVLRPVHEGLQNAISSAGRPLFRLWFLRPLDQLAIAEAFSRPIRTFITVTALTLAGVALLSSTNMFSSLVGVVDRLLASRHDTIDAFTTDRPDIPALTSRLSRIEGMQRFELWDRKSVSLSTPNVSGERLPMISPPVDTQMGRPEVVQGRWPTQKGEIAVSSLTIGHFSRLKLEIGSEVLLTAGDRTIPARVVGLVDEFGMSIWTNEATFTGLAVDADRSREIRAIVAPDKVTAGLLAVEQAIIDSGAFPSGAMTATDRRAGMVNHFFSFYQFLLAAALTASVVGGAALSATVSSNVLERTREIGILRAMGATSGALFRLVLVQSLAISITGLALAAVLAIPISMLIVDQLEEKALHIYMPLKVSWMALTGWTLGSLVIAAVAALAPAVRIGTIPVREAISQD